MLKHAVLYEFLRPVAGTNNLCTWGGSHKYFSSQTFLCISSAFGQNLILTSCFTSNDKVFAGLGRD